MISIGMHKKRGLTLIEILLAISIIGILCAITFFSLSQVRSKEVLDTEAGEVVSILELARSQGLGSKDKSEYGVHFASSTITLFKGTSYSASASTNVVKDLHATIEVRSLSLSTTTQNIVFERLTGEAISTGTVTLGIRGDVTSTKRIIIRSTGLIDIE
jgi:prepilin-type N-terminal cleavage/methylation domain-containing protein